MKLLKIGMISLIAMFFGLSLTAQIFDWNWVAQAGGSGNQWSTDIAVDSTGNSYIIGTFPDSISIGGCTLVGSGDRNIFVAKINSEGNWLWATTAGGNGFDVGSGITVDSYGNCYVTGTISSSASFGNITLNATEKDIFVAKLDSDGNWLWARNAGGCGQDNGYHIAIDDSRNCYVMGDFQGTAYFGGTELTSVESSDIFVSKLDCDGNWIWTRKAGGPYNNWVYGFAVDPSGNSSMMGYYYESVDLVQTRQTDEGIFILTLDTDGNWLWGQRVNGTNVPGIDCITNDNNGNTYITGVFAGTIYFGDTTLTSLGNNDIYVAKIDADGDWLWARMIDGHNLDYPQGITIDNLGNCCIIGYFFANASFGDSVLTSSGGYNVFAAKLDSSGSWLSAHNVGSLTSADRVDIAIDPSGYSVITGSFWNYANIGGNPLYSSDGYDIFVAKFLDDTWVAIPDTGSNLHAPVMPYLESCSPNPFNPSTTVYYNLPASGHATITVFDLRGRMISTILDDNITAGKHSVIWNGKDSSGADVASGVYTMRLEAGGRHHIRKVTLMK